MRVVLIGPVYPYRGGIAHYTTMLCRTLRDRGHDVLMVSFKRQYPQWLFPGKSDKDPSKEPLEVEDARYWIDSLNPLTWLTTFWRVRRYHPDMMVLQWWTTFFALPWFTLGLLNRLLLRKPLTVICHNVLPHETRRWDPTLTKLTLYWATRCVVQSREEEERLRDLMPRALVDIAPHPVYDMYRHRRVSRYKARSKLGLPRDVPILLFFGIIRQYKGLEDLLRALTQVQSTEGKTLLIVAGEFWDNKQPYVELIEKMGIADSVIIEDRYIANEEVPLYFSAADVMVAPYRRATGSGVLQMAQGFGMPTVSTKQSTDQFGDSLVDTHVQPGDIQALARAITEALNRGKGSSGRTARAEAPRDSWVSLARLIEETS